MGGDAVAEELARHIGTSWKGSGNAMEETIMRYHKTGPNRCCKALPPCRPTPSKPEPDAMIRDEIEMMRGIRGGEERGAKMLGPGGGYSSAGQRGCVSSASWTIKGRSGTGRTTALSPTRSAVAARFDEASWRWAMEE